MLEESEENLRARYAIILKQREEAYRRLEEAKATVKHMEDKAAHYEAILAGLSPDDTNPRNWTVESRPRHWRPLLCFLFCISAQNGLK